MYEGHHCRRVRFGDVEAGLRAGRPHRRGRYQSAPIEHAPTETTGCIVVPEANGRLTSTPNTQALFFSLDNTAMILQVPFSKLQFVGGTVGGGFGGKVDVIVEPIACLAAMKTNRPVKFVYSREEEMQVSSPRAAERIYIKDGVMNDGRIVARKVTLYVDSGAYSRHTPYGTTKAAAHMPGPVHDPERLVDAYCVYTNRTPSERDARLRRHDRRLRARGADGQASRALLGIDPLRVPLPQRLPRRRHEGAPQGRRGRRADRDHPGGRGARRARAAARSTGP